MIRDAVIHLLNEQPLVADLYEMPGASDVGLVCTNLRTLTGKRPVYVDHSESDFFFPYLHVRFVEVPRDRAGRAATGESSEALPEPAPGTPEEDLELDEDFLRRIREA